MTEQNEVRCVIMRGGTSKGLYLREQDVTPPGPARDTLLLRLMGSPDILQIDGLGGSRPITSKVAIIGPSNRPDADVDYTFAQVGIEQAGVGYSGNCGNISAGVGPFAIDEGMIAVPFDGEVNVRIWNTNTEVLLVAIVQVRRGRAAVAGDLEIPGVPGTGSEIVMNWVHTVGAKTGALLPTGSPADSYEMESGQCIIGSLVDAGSPVLWIHAEDMGLTGSELSARINDDTELIDRLRELRGKAAVAAGLCHDWRTADTESPGLPMLGMVAAPADYVTLNGALMRAGDMDLRVRLIFLDLLHESIAGTGSMSLAAASRIPGTTAAAVVAGIDERRLHIGHPSGIMPVVVQAHPTEAGPAVAFDVLGMSRTARRLMSGTAYV